jgi:hypothetical protein
VATYYYTVEYIIFSGDNLSHYSILKVSIRNPNISLLKQTFQAMGFQITDAITDYWGSVRKDFIFAVKNDVFKRGIGIKINDKGQVHFIGDFYMLEDEVARLTKELTKNYLASALTVGLKSMGYTQVTVSPVKDMLVVNAVA